MTYLEAECDGAEAWTLSGNGSNDSAMAYEVAGLRAQMRVLRGIAMGSLGVSMVVLALLAHSFLGGSGVHTTVQGRSTSMKVPTTQLWEEEEVIVPYGFKACDSAAGSPQMAPIRKSGDFLFLSGILGYEKPCKSAVKDVEKQIIAAFKWANDTLETAKVQWSDVLSVTSYHVNLDEHHEIFKREREKVFEKPPYPAWTALGVKQLYFDHEVFEMSIIAEKICVGLECD